jgi:hypothetical protein
LMPIPLLKKMHFLGNWGPNKRYNLYRYQWTGRPRSGPELSHFYDSYIVDRNYPI